jgi:hypothetical protein
MGSQDRYIRRHSCLEKKYTYVEDVALQGDGVVFRLHRRFDGQPIAIRIDVWDHRGIPVRSFFSSSMSPVAPDAERWIVKSTIRPGFYRVRIELEDCCAFDARLLHGDIPF